MAKNSYAAMRRAVFDSYEQKKPVAVLTKTTATDMLLIAKRIGLSIPTPVVVRSTTNRRTELLYDYIDNGGA